MGKGRGETGIHVLLVHFNEYNNLFEKVNK